MQAVGVGQSKKCLGLPHLRVALKKVGFKRYAEVRRKFYVLKKGWLGS